MEKNIISRYKLLTIVAGSCADYYYYYILCIIIIILKIMSNRRHCALYFLLYRVVFSKKNIAYSTFYILYNKIFCWNCWCLQTMAETWMLATERDAL